MKKYNLLLLAAVFIAGSLQAQQRRNCATHDHYLKAIADDPAIVARRANMEQQIQSVITNNASQRTSSAHDVLVTVPVVVHVVYQNATQNISDAQIISQIDVLNADYAHLNADSVITPAAFQPLMNDVGIRFCLAAQDPAGNATTGIERRSTTVSNIGGTSKYYNYSQGGLSAWDHTKYLNIWVCSIDGGNILGFAYLPGVTGAADDGVVIDPQYFGTLGSVSAPFNKGRTATHEVGHWFNLEHIWGDEPSCSQDDFVSDTPLQKGENYGCPSYPQTSQSGGRCSTSDPSSMFMNYMDYTDDACMVMFSIGQRDRMQAAVNVYRSGLITSLGCQAPVGISTINSGAWLSLLNNPTSGLVEFSTTATKGNLDVQVTDLAGRIILTSSFQNQNRCSFDLSAYPAGVYLMQVNSSEGRAIRKIVKE